MKPIGLLLAICLCQAGCASEASSSDSTESPVVIEHSADDLRKAVLSRSYGYDGPGNVVLYCELPVSTASSSCDPATSLAMSLPTYARKLGEAFDRLLPQYAGTIASLTQKVRTAASALTDAQNQVRTTEIAIRERTDEVHALVEPLTQQRDELQGTLDSRVARNAFIEGELERIRTALAAPNLSAEDRQILTTKQTLLVNDRDANATQIAALVPRLTALVSHIDEVANHDAALLALQAQSTAAQARVTGSARALERAETALQGAVSEHDDKVAAKLQVVIGDSFTISDFGDSASRLVFAPFRDSTAFAKADSCSLNLTHVSPGSPAAIGEIGYNVTVAADVIFPAQTTLTPGPASGSDKVIFFETWQAMGYMGFYRPNYPNEVALTVTWPKLEAVHVPTADFQCTKVMLATH